MIENPTVHIKSIFTRCREKIQVFQSGGTTLSQLNQKGEAPIQMDIELDETILGYLREYNLPIRFLSEESHWQDITPNPRYTLITDPLDGSVNYANGKGQALMPHGTFITIFRGLEPTLNDVVASGAILYPQNASWLYNGHQTHDMDGRRVSIRSDWIFGQKTPVYFDLYYKQGYEAYRCFAEKIFIRNTGSTIGNTSLVLTNHAAALGGVCMRAEEVGAVYSLIKGAGGLVVDHQGRDVGFNYVDIDRTYQILAGSLGVIPQMVNELRIPQGYS